MARYLAITEYIWDAESDGWLNPSSSLLGVIDLRPNSLCGTRGGTDGRCLVVTEEIDPNFDITLGDGLGIELSTPVRRAIEDRLSLPPGTFQSTNVLDLLWELFTVHADPTGQDRVKPIMPRHNGIMELNLGGFSPIRREQYDRVKHPRVLELLRSDFQKEVAQSELSLTRMSQHNKTWTELRSYAREQRGQMSRSELRDTQHGRDIQGLLSLSNPDDHRRSLGGILRKYGRYGVTKDDVAPGIEPLVPGTTYSDSFNASNGALVSHTPQPTDWGAWAEVKGDHDIVSNKHEFSTLTASESLARADFDTDLSYDDMATTGTADYSGNDYGSGVSARCNGSDTDCYFTTARARSGADGFLMFKVVSTVRSDVGTRANGPAADGEVQILTVDGSTQVFNNAGTDEISDGTDTAISTGKRAGLGAYQNRSGSNGMDDWSVEDIAPASTTPRLTLLGVG